jgi:alpha-L-fucosidase
LVHSFVDRVSKGGNLLLNLSPMADGTFPQEQKDIMSTFGKFLRQAGTANYNTRPWVVYGEGPTKLGGGGMGQQTAMTANDIRYTKSKDGDAVYAIIMGWPGNGKQVTLASVTTARFALGSGKVFLFGPSGNGGDALELSATQDGAGLKVTLPATQPYQAAAYALKISKTGTQPEATPWTVSGASPDGGVIDSGATGAGGAAGSVGRGGANARGASGQPNATPARGCSCSIQGKPRAARLESLLVFAAAIGGMFHRTHKDGRRTRG